LPVAVMIRRSSFGEWSYSLDAHSFMRVGSGLIGKMGVSFRSFSCFELRFKIEVR
jgi:hypothetical protein